jgi:DNA-binding PadR family transcriptional regulator
VATPHPDDLPAPGDLLPLPPATLHILLALADEDRHGYAIRSEVAARTNGAVRMSAGTLYRSLQRMVEQGLIEECDARPAPALDDERRRYYRLTAFGGEVLAAEVERLDGLVRAARKKGAFPTPKPEGV